MITTAMMIVVICTLILLIAGYAIAKNYDAKLVLFMAGIVLMLCAAAMGHSILPEAATTGSAWLDPLKQIRLAGVYQAVWWCGHHHHGVVWVFGVYVQYWGE